jgi:hypothetical protein
MADEDKDKAEKVAAAKKRVCDRLTQHPKSQALTQASVRAIEEAKGKGEQERHQQEEGR